MASDDSRHAKWEDLGHAELDLTGIFFHPKDPKILYGASPTTGLHVSKDDGASWKLLEKENYNSVGFTSEGEGWAVGPKGRIAKFER